MFFYLKKLEQIFFYLFIISIPFEKRHVFETPISIFDGHFIEWFSLSLYLSDIFLILTILLWFLRLFSQKFDQTAIKTINKKRFIKKATYFFVVFIFFGIISTLFSSSVNFSIFNLLLILLYGILFFYIATNINTNKKILLIILLFIGTAFIQSLIGIVQFIKQGSMGLKILGEVDLSPSLINVSKIVLDNERYIRAYGSFPHSNVLGGFLYVSIILALFFILYIINLNLNNRQNNRYSCNIKMFHVEHFKVLGLNLPNIKNSLPLFTFIFFVLMFCLVLTFSRSAWAALSFTFLLIIFIILFITPNIRKSISTSFKRNFNKLNILIILFVFIAVSILIFWPYISTRNPINQYNTDNYSIEGRELYSIIAFNMINDNILFGVSPGLFVFESPNYTTINLSWWQLQPVHNVFLLVACEHGLLGFIAFSFFIIYILLQSRHVNKGIRNNYYINQLLFFSLLSIIIGLFIIMLFDHYLWTIRQGSYTFWLMLGLFIACINIYKNARNSNICDMH